MTNISEKYHNYSYAPGLATYGINGQTGAQGNDGTCIFYTDIQLNNDDSYKSLATLIANQLLPISSERIPVKRKYQENDLFIDPNGNVYQIINLKNIISITSNGGSITPSECFTQKGQISSVQSNVFSDNTRSKIKEGYTGLTISNSNAVTPSSDAVLNLASLENSGGNAEFINMDVIYGSSPNANLSIYYNANQQAFHIDSSYPIVIDSNLYVKYSEDSKDTVSEYVKIATSNNSITNSYALAQQVTYSLDTSIYQYYKSNDEQTKYYGTLYYITLTGSEDILNYIYDENKIKTIHIQRQEFQDFQNIKENRFLYVFKEDLDFINPYTAKTFINDTSQNIHISLIDNIEVYLQKEKH